MRVIHAGADANRIETPDNLRPLTGHWTVKHRRQTIVAVGLVSGGNIEDPNMSEIGQPPLQRCKIFRTALQDDVKALELLAADRGINVAKAIVDTERKHIINTGNGALGERTIDAEGPCLGYFLRQIGMAGDQHAAITRGDMLDGIERECPGITEQSGMNPVLPRSERQ